MFDSTSCSRARRRADGKTDVEKTNRILGFLKRGRVFSHTPSDAQVKTGGTGAGKAASRGRAPRGSRCAGVKTRPSNRMVLSGESLLKTINTFIAVRAAANLRPVKVILPYKRDLASQ